MFGFGRTPDPRSPSTAICRVIEQAGLPERVSSSSMLRVVESRGSYSGRKVTFVRIFDPARAAESAVTVKQFGDLDPHPSLVLWSGHVESDGGVSIISRAPAPKAATPSRAAANRAGHDDDERFVFFDRDAAVRGDA